MAQLIVCLFLWFNGLYSAQASGLSFHSKVEFSSQAKCKGARIGGLYSLLLENGELVSLSDDRGRIQNPRYFRFQYSIKSNHLQVTCKSVHFLKKAPYKVLDMEALAPLPWGNYLVSSEGDFDRKPRAMPELFEIKADGGFVRDFEIPKKFLPEPTGLQTKGLANNRAFEGLAVSPSLRRWIVAPERPLISEKSNELIFVEYHSPEPWTLKAKTEYRYPLAEIADDQGLMSINSVSEVLFFDEDQVLVLERGVRVLVGEIKFSFRLYKARLKKGLLEKQLLTDFAFLDKEFPAGLPNFEGLSWGPQLDGQRSLLLVSDNDFKKSQATFFVLVKL